MGGENSRRLAQKDLAAWVTQGTTFPAFTPHCELLPLGQGGSDRLYFRVIEGDTSAILLVSSERDLDFHSYLEIGNYLFKQGVPVARFYRVDEQHRLVLMEDLGDTLLVDLVRENGWGDLLPTYQTVIKILARMQVMGSWGMDSCPSLANRTFDYRALRWETTYFRERFLNQFCGLGVGEEVLDGEFHRLATLVEREPRFFMHRDFQSENLLIKDGQIRVIDFQSARQGLLAYDLASILKDAYVDMPGPISRELLHEYVANLNGVWGVQLDEEQFSEVFLLAGLQRNMQALGAFAFLTLVKGKVRFANHIPTALGHLRAALAQRRDFPRLTEVVNVPQVDRCVGIH
jgi:aminoglycoside/choline kinase family phosphotransferase